MNLLILNDLLELKKLEVLFKFQYESINTELSELAGDLTYLFKFQYETINTPLILLL